MKYLLALLLLTSSLTASEATFTPPQGWSYTEKIPELPYVKTMVYGKGKSNFPPSMNLSSEEFKGSLPDYLKIVKKINESKGLKWKDLGKIQTLSGEASLSQVDSVIEWGPIRMMHVILVKDENVFILTAIALQNEFSVHYKEFFEALRSLKVE